MPLDAETASWVALTQIPGLGDESLRRLLQAFGSPETVFAASPLALRDYVKPAVAERIARGPDTAGMDTLAQWLAAEGNSIITLADTRYPSALLATPDPPVLLYVEGAGRFLHEDAPPSARRLAIVGSRTPTAQGR